MNTDKSRKPHHYTDVVLLIFVDLSTIRRDREFLECNIFTIHCMCHFCPGKDFDLGSFTITASSKILTNEKYTRST